MRAIERPCGWYDGNSTVLPAVVCKRSCESCGFNPYEQERRIENGKFEIHTVTHHLHDDDGVTIIDSLTKQVNTLHFRRK